jgi:hypothetical protein
MGAIHTLAGATTVAANPTSPFNATVGVAVTGVVFAVTGTQNPPSSWSVDAIPPGMNFEGHTTPGTYNVVSQYGTAVLSGTPTTAGTFTLNLVAYEYNNGTGLSTLPFPYTVHVTATGPPVITTQPASQTVNAGTSPTLGVAAPGATGYQWQLNGSPISGATDSTLTLSNIGTTQRGSYTVAASNTYGSVTSGAATIAVSAATHLDNISSRAYLGAGANQNLVAGFYTDGSGSKKILVCGVGPGLLSVAPSLAGQVLVAPKLTLINGTGATLAIDTAWGGSQNLASAIASVYAIPMAANSDDSVVFTDVPAGPGIGYSAQIDGLNNGTGIALVEVSDYDSYTGTPASHLISISTRAFVGPGEQSLVGGFSIGGSTSQTLLVGAVGPALASIPSLSGQTLPKPTLTLYDASGAVIASNAGWSNPPIAGSSSVPSGIQPATAAIIGGVYATPLAAGSADCAMVVTLPPGSYTAQVSSADSSTGIALVEIYNVP